MTRRDNGISVLLSAQNEENTIQLSIFSFLAFADEIIVVDNGSIDYTKSILENLSSEYPEILRVFFMPTLRDLPESRQYAFLKSRFRWVVRADADFVAYTSGSLNIRNFRDELLSAKRTPDRPKAFGLPQPNVTGDFWHTGKDQERLPGKEEMGRYVPPAFFSGFMMRVYEVFPGFEFCRRGRWEGVKHQELLRKHAIERREPVWMHCNVKSKLNYLMRSERTNWRELGDFTKYPTLEDYLYRVVLPRYDCTNLTEAAEHYFNNGILPFLKKYDPKAYFDYPALVQKQININPIYQITSNGKIERNYLGLLPIVSEP